MPDIERIGKYEIVEIIGEGGMGTVYKALDTIIRRHVAIKMMTETRFDQETSRKRFFREAQAIGQLQHPNIIMIHDAGEYKRMPYLVVEFLDGDDLGALLRNNSLPPTKDLYAILIDICSALEYSHQQGIIHRDIKPANIFYLKSGTAKLVDFGISKMSDTLYTRTGTLLGTIHYMSPEQIEGKDVDYRTDIFSLGVVMYEMFCRKRPFEGNTYSEILTKILLSEPQPFEPLDGSISPVLSSIINKSLEKKNENRYQSASELAVALAEAQQILEPSDSVQAQNFQEASTVSISYTEIKQPLEAPVKSKEKITPPPERALSQEREQPPEKIAQAPVKKSARKETYQPQVQTPHKPGRSWGWLFLGISIILVLCLAIFMIQFKDV
ncbi:serine/threonine protein kinase, partial [candidate division CSSED10-310 bacterium]